MRVTRKEASNRAVIYYWITSRAGKPQKCDNCGATDSERRYIWTNISGEYKRELSDWKRICVSCFRRKGDLGYCKNGHRLSKKNIAVRADGTKDCRICHRAAMRRYRAKNEP